MGTNKKIVPSLSNPFYTPEKKSFSIPGEITREPGAYEAALSEGWDLMQRPFEAAGTAATEKQHLKKRMTVWERLRVLSKKDPIVLYQNWGKNLDGASLVTAILNIDGRDVAVYGHDFTVRAGSIDACNGRTLANLRKFAGEKGMTLIGMYECAGAYVPAVVGGVDD